MADASSTETAELGIEICESPRDNLNPFDSSPLPLTNSGLGPTGPSRTSGSVVITSATTSHHSADFTRCIVTVIAAVIKAKTTFSGRHGVPGEANLGTRKRLITGRRGLSRTGCHFDRKLVEAVGTIEKGVEGSRKRCSYQGQSRSFHPLSSHLSFLTDWMGISGDAEQSDAGTVAIVSSPPFHQRTLTWHCQKCTPGPTRIPLTGILRFR